MAMNLYQGFGKRNLEIGMEGVAVTIHIALPTTFPKAFPERLENKINMS